MNVFIPVREKSLRAEGSSTTYSIAVYHNFHKVKVVRDVSSRFSFVIALCAKFTFFQLSLLHLDDVLDDML